MNSMIDFFTGRRRTGSRILAVLLVSTFVMGNITPAIVSAVGDLEQTGQMTLAAGEDGDAAASGTASGEKLEVETTKTLYKWERVASIDDLPKNDWTAALVWENNGSNYLLDTTPSGKGYVSSLKSWPIEGSRITDEKYAGLQAGVESGADEFYIAQDIDLVTMSYQGKDKDNDNKPVFWLKMDGMVKNNEKNVWLSVHNYKDRNKINSWRFIYTDNPRMDYDSSIFSNWTAWQGSAGSNYITFRLNLKKGMADEYIYQKDSTILNYENKDSYKDAPGFKIYKVTEETYSCLAKDYTVQSGQTQRLNDVYIAKDVTLTVEEDAVLLLSGVIMYDGNIVNNGTVILQEDGVLQPLTASDLLGNFTCPQGDLLVMKGAKLLCPRGLSLSTGATCVNFGIMLVSGEFNMNNAFFENRKGGTLLLGFSIYPAGFSGGSMKSNNTYAGSWVDGTVKENAVHGGPIPRYYVSGKIYAANILGNSRLINCGVVNRQTRLVLSTDAVYETRDDGKALDADEAIQNMEKYYDDCVGPTQWYWTADGRLYYDQSSARFQ